MKNKSLHSTAGELYMSVCWHEICIQVSCFCFNRLSVEIHYASHSPSFIVQFHASPALFPSMLLLRGEVSIKWCSELIKLYLEMGATVIQRVEGCVSVFAVPIIGAGAKKGATCQLSTFYIYSCFSPLRSCIPHLLLLFHTFWFVSPGTGYTSVPW